MKKVNKKIYLMIATVLLVFIVIVSYTGIKNRIKENRNKEEIK